MSWDSYLDNLVSQTRDSTGAAHCDKAVFMGLDGGGSWTTSTHPKALPIRPGEAVHIAKIMKLGKAEPFQRDGVVIDGHKFRFLREDENLARAYFKSKGHGSICIAKSKTAIIISHCTEEQQAGNLNNGTSNVIEHLEKMGM